jgi:hypothetical protein
MGSGQARAAVAIEAVKNGKLVKSDTVKTKKPKKTKIEERAWYKTTPGRFTRMKRKERFVQSLKSVVDMLGQKGLVALPEDLLTTALTHKLITQREFKRLVSVTDAAVPPATTDVAEKKTTTKKIRKVGTVTQTRRDGKKVTVGKVVG